MSCHLGRFCTQREMEKWLSQPLAQLERSSCAFPFLSNTERKVNLCLKVPLARRSILYATFVQPSLYAIFWYLSLFLSRCFSQLKSRAVVAFHPEVAWPGINNGNTEGASNEDCGFGFGLQLGMALTELVCGQESGVSQNARSRLTPWRQEQRLC